MKHLVISTLAVLAFAGATQAATINGAASGLTGADRTLTFSEVSLSTKDSVTDQFATYGVTFSPNLVYYGNVQDYPNFTDPALGNFALDGSNPPVPSAPIDPFVINFTSDVTAASFAMASNPTTTTFTAFLDGEVVESFSAGTDSGSANNFFGFTGTLFDQIRVDTGNRYAFIDNLAFAAAPVSAVPLPAGLPLLLGALGGFAMLRRRQNV
ncbi:VPLPA-CTERM sorting domain-containing protein [Rhodobacteraceae bacterium F11138]|nr:VPLPA-CTERM sorting domain-containing protein [Rhodobacteraceae bacterium F11138]